MGRMFKTPLVFRMGFITTKSGSVYKPHSKYYKTSFSRAFFGNNQAFSYQTSRHQFFKISRSYTRIEKLPKGFR